MINIIIWIARSINTQGAMERIQSLKIIHQITMIVILEYFSANSQLQNCRVQLGMEKTMCNNNGKIWVFWNHEIECSMLKSDDQQLTCEIPHPQISNKFISTFVYAKCREKILHLADRFKGIP